MCEHDFSTCCSSLGVVSKKTCGDKKRLSFRSHVIRLKRGRNKGPERAFTALFESISEWDCKTVEGKECEIAFFTSCLPHELSSFPSSVRLKGFPNLAIRQITAKGLLAQTLMYFKGKKADVFNFFPTSFVLPRQRDLLKKFVQNNKDALFISKPAFAAGGRGINVGVDVEELLRSNESRVVQQYITKPLLVNGYKFDLRIYVLVKSYKPFTIYIHEEGLVRFCTEPYPEDPEWISNCSIQHVSKLAHLTNYKVNKKSKNFKCNNNSSKWKLSKFWRYAACNLPSVDKDLVWKEIKKITSLCFNLVGDDVRFQQQNSLPQDENFDMCWDLFGIDVMLEDTGRVWLLEINRNPSLRTDLDVDKVVKKKLLRDVLNILFPVTCISEVNGFERL